MAGGAAVVSSSAATTSYEAESAALSGGARVETEHAGYTGSGYVGGFTDTNRGTAAATFAVRGAAGAHQVEVRYANGTGSTRTVSLAVNGAVSQLSLPATGGWSSWGTATGTVALTGGSDTLVLHYGTADNGNVNIDNVDITPATGQYEAESGALSGGARVETEHAGFTGTGYVGGFVDANRGSAAVTWSVSATGPATATLRYANGTGASRTVTLTAGGTAQQVVLPATAGWAAWGTVAVPLALRSGANSVMVSYGQGDNGNVNIDSLTVSAAPTTTPPTTTTPQQPGTGATYELETAFTSGGATTGTDGATGYVTVVPGSRVLRTVNRQAAGSAAVTLRYRNTSGSPKTVSAYANGLKTGQLTLAAGGWQTLQHTAPLRSGLNLLGYQADAGDSGGVQLDNAMVAGGLPLAARGATLPYTTYEAEDGTTTGTRLAAGRTYTTDVAEASGRRAVKLTGTGQHVQVTLTKPANAITVRAGIPDSADGAGTTAPLAVYADGAKVRDLTLTSRYSWMYGPYPFAGAPGGERPHRFFDDARALLPRTYPAGTVLRFAKDTAATEYVTVDLVEAETADPAATAPPGYVSVTAHGAVAGDAGDDSAAFRAAVAAARNTTAKGVWIPAGTFTVASLVRVSGVDVRGAGPWHTVLLGRDRRGGFLVEGGDTQLGDFTFDGDVTTRDPDDAPNSDAAVEGDFGTGSLVRNIATNHAKAGLWAGGSTTGLYAVGLRIRNTMADGVNVNGRADNVRLEQSTLRNTGDDALAMWSWNSAGWHVKRSVFAHNTIALPILANGAAVYGGTDNRVEDNLVTDTVFQGSGVTVSSWHDAAPFGGTTTVQRNTLTRTGAYSLDWGSPLGAVWLYAPSTPITGAVVLRDLQVLDSTYQGLLTSWQQPITSLAVEGVTVDGTLNSAPGMEFSTPGTGTFSQTTVRNTSGPALLNNGGFTVVRGPGNVGF